MGRIYSRDVLPKVRNIPNDMLLVSIDIESEIDALCEHAFTEEQYDLVASRICSTVMMLGMDNAVMVGAMLELGETEYHYRRAAYMILDACGVPFVEYEW